MNNLPNLSDLKVFCTVAKRKSFVDSAEELGASPAFISKRINILETNLNCKLFHRSTRHVSLTEDGKLILDRVSNILDEFDEISELVNNPLSTPTGRMDIVSSFGFGRKHIAPILSKLMTMYPKLEIQFDTIDNTKDLIQHSIDLDIRIGNDIAPNMIAKKLAPNFRIFCASPSYLMKNGIPESLEDLRTHDCLTISERDQSSVLWKLRHCSEDRSVHVTPRFVSNNGEIIHQLATEGHGIILRSIWDVADELISGQLQHILPQYWQDADVWAVYPSRLKSSSKLQTCILFIQNELINRLQHIQNLSRGQLIQPIEPITQQTEKVFL
ncbi:LysR family transcriptional regulator [Acinetobacter ursingii]|uniref:LysR family transcriptional regulator n=1 Tax=Acinetobacter ursingii TaxID=108980 RepID=UPI0032B4D2F4